MIFKNISYGWMDDLGVVQGRVDAILMLMHLIKVNPPILKHSNLLLHIQPFRVSPSPCRWDTAIKGWGIWDLVVSADGDFKLWKNSLHL